MRTAVIGDVHGCLTELRALVAEFAPQPSDQVVFVGDLLDKGPFPAETVAYVRSLGARMVLGNHEEKHLRWRQHEDRRRNDSKYVNPMQPLHQDAIKANEALTKEDIAWLQGLPTFLEVQPGWVVVHGGLFSRSLEEHRLDKRLGEKCRRLRWLDSEGEHVSVLYDKDGRPESLSGVQHWAEVYDGRYNVVYGHEAHDFAHPRIDHKPQGTACYGIDTGVVHGGHLTALVLEPGKPVEFLQVSAREVYQEPPSSRLSV